MNGKVLYNKDGNSDGCTTEGLLDSSLADKYKNEDKLVIMVDRGSCTFT